MPTLLLLALLALLVALPALLHAAGTGLLSRLALLLPAAPLALLGLSTVLRRPALSGLPIELALVRPLAVLLALARLLAVLLALVGLLAVLLALAGLTPLTGLLALPVLLTLVVSPGLALLLALAVLLSLAGLLAVLSRLAPLLAILLTLARLSTVLLALSGLAGPGRPAGLPSWSLSLGPLELLLAGRTDRVLLGLHAGLGQLLRLLDGPLDGVDVALEQVPRQMEAPFLRARSHLHAVHEHLGRVLLQPQGLLHRCLDGLLEHLFPARRLVSVVHGILPEIVLVATSRVRVASGVGYDVEPMDKATKPFIGYATASLRYAPISFGYAVASLRASACNGLKQCVDRPAAAPQIVVGRRPWERSKR